MERLLLYSYTIYSLTVYRVTVYNLFHFPKGCGALNLTKFLPLTETTYYILLSLTSPLHGYGIMQNVEELSQGRVKIAAGTLYGALDNLLKNQLITLLDHSGDSRRKVYQITDYGMEVLQLEYERMVNLIHVSDRYLGRRLS